MGAFYTIRPPQTDDEWSAVRQMLLDYYDEFEDKTCFTSFDAELQNIKAVYAEKGKWKLIAVEQPGGKVVGCVGIRTLSPGLAEMKRLYVIPSHRKLQLGKKLAEEIISLSIREGYERMILDTMMEMKQAQGLYKRLGFEEMEPYNHQDPEKVICYEKILVDL